MTTHHCSLCNTDFERSPLHADHICFPYGESEVIEEPARGLGLSTDPAERKAVPIHSGVIRYFPDALAAVAELSKIGNDQHNPGETLHWAREKSGDELDALTRHLMEAGTIDTDGVRHSTKVAWRALANLQKEIEISLGIDPNVTR